MILNFCYVFLLLIMCIIKIVFNFGFYLFIGILIHFLVYKILDFSILEEFKKIFINLNIFLDNLY